MEDQLIGQQLGNFRIDSIIGRGGMGTVYFGFDVSLHRSVAVKVIDSRYRDSASYTNRFLQEARTVASWRHDNIIQVYHAGQEDEIYYFAMEYVDGSDLKQLMKQFAAGKQLMRHEDVLEIGRAVANALDYAHSQGVVHRDVKPSNVMLASDGRIILTDFGLALTAWQGSKGGAFGSPRYIAPEQARRSEMAVPQSDVYSLGVILYEMLIGAVPFDDPSPASLAFQHLTQPPPPPRQMNPELNLATETVLLKALSKRPEDRYESGAELIDALAEALRTLDVVAGEDDSPRSRPSVFAREASHSTVAEPIHRHGVPPPIVKGAAKTVTPPNVSPPENSDPKVKRPSGVPSTAVTDKHRSPLRWAAVGAGLLALLAVVWLLFGTRDDETAETTSLVLLPTPSISKSADSTNEGEMQPPGPQVMSTGTAASGLPEPVPTQTVMLDPTGSQLAEPTSALPAATATLAPSVTPSGPRLIMFYDPTSFYLYNPNRDTEIRVSELSFEALDENGELSGYWFEGRRWSQYYSFVESFGCASLEVTGKEGWLRPPQCRVYNAVITPDRQGDFVFWTPRSGVVQFSVLWQGVEIGRCDVFATQCEAYLP